MCSWYLGMPMVTVGNIADMYLVVAASKVPHAGSMEGVWCKQLVRPDCIRSEVWRNSVTTQTIIVQSLVCRPVAPYHMILSSVASTACFVKIHVRFNLCPSALQWHSLAYRKHQRARLTAHCFSRFEHSCTTLNALFASEGIHRDTNMILAIKSMSSVNCDLSNRLLMWFNTDILVDICMSRKVACRLIRFLFNRAPSEQSGLVFNFFFLSHFCLACVMTIVAYMSIILW